jgi:hypothetical protein
MSWQEKLPVLLALGFAVLIVYGVMSRDHFVPEFLDQRNVQKTQETANSSYKQTTNSVRPNGKFDAPPIQGVISPFRVNMWDSYIP